MPKNPATEKAQPALWRVEVTQDAWQVFWVRAATHHEAQAIANGVKHDSSDWEYGDVEVRADWSPSEPDENGVVWIDGGFRMAHELPQDSASSPVAAPFRPAPVANSDHARVTVEVEIHRESDAQTTAPSARFVAALIQEYLAGMTVRGWKLGVVVGVTEDSASPSPTKDGTE